MSIQNLISNNSNPFGIFSHLDSINYVPIIPIASIEKLSTFSFIVHDVLKPFMAFVGTLYCIKVFIYSILNTHTALRLYVWPMFFKSNLVQKYGEYVIITNTLDCIGKELALAFARRGHSLVLIGEKNEHFEEVQKEISEELAPDRCLRVIYFDDTMNDDRIYQHIEDEIADIKSEIGILVNNAGVTNNKCNKFLDYTDEGILDLIHADILDVIMITKAVLPIMIENKKGLILNVTSPSNFRPVAFSGFASTMKDFVNKFSKIVSGEYGMHNIEVQTLNPGWIMEEAIALSNTKIFKSTKKMFSSVSSSVEKWKEKCGIHHDSLIDVDLPFDLPTYNPSYILPTAESFVHSAMMTIGKCEETCGHWAHSLMKNVVDTIPKSLHTLLFYIYRKFHDKEKLSEKEEVMEALSVLKEILKK